MRNGKGDDGHSRLRALVERALGWRRRLEAAHVVSTIRHQVSPRALILDLGCGRGYVGALLESSRDASAVGCDVVPANEMLDRFCLFDGWNLPFADRAFDVAVLGFILHHAADPLALLREVRRVTSGPLVILEDTPRVLADRAYAALHVRGFNRCMGIAWRGRILSEREWREVFLELGLHPVECRMIPRRRRWPPVARTIFVLEAAIISDQDGLVD